MKHKLLSLLTPLLFFGFLFSFLLLSLYLDDNVYSTTEARALAQRPVNDPAILSELSAQWEDYAIDQFPLRERMLKIYSGINLSLGKSYLRNTYVSADGWLTTYVYSADAQNREAMLSALRQTVASLPTVDFAYVVTPQKNDMVSSGNAPYQTHRNSSENKAALLEGLSSVDRIQVIDIGSYFTAQFTAFERESLYYRTDFHWNDLGAFCAAEYTATCLEGDTAPSREDFLWEEVGANADYLGDLNRRFSYLLSTKEAIPFYTLPSAESVSYFLSGDREAARESIVARGVGVDKELNYNTVSTDNLGYFRIENPDARTDKTVLILKDSLENPMTDYFTALYRQVIVIDPRSYAEPYSLAELTERYGVDLVLFVYHQNNISTELTQFLGA